MLAFVQAQANVVDRLLRHIETPAFADLLVRIIQLDEVPSCSGVLEVCHPFSGHALPRATLTSRRAVAIPGEPHVAPTGPALAGI